MSESAPSYGVRPVTQNVQLLARVLDCDVDELIDRALEEAFDRSLSDPDIKAAFEALSRLDARRAAREQAAADTSADCAMRETDPEEPDGSLKCESCSEPATAFTLDDVPLCNRCAKELAEEDAPAPDEKTEHVDRGPGFTHGGNAETCCAADDASEEEEEERPMPGVKAPTLTTEQRQRSASVVRQARIDRALSQVEVAQKLGVSPATVSMIERAAHAVAAETVRKAVQWAQAE